MVGYQIQYRDAKTFEWRVYTSIQTDGIEPDFPRAELIAAGIAEIRHAPPIRIMRVELMKEWNK